MNERATLVLYQGDGRLKTHPFVIMFMLLLVASGVGSLIGEAEPGSIDALLPSWAAYVWGGFLLTGSVLALAGVLGFRLQHVRFLVVEQIGMAISGAAIIFYALCVVLYVGMAGFMTIAMGLAFTVCCGWRYWQIQSLIDDAESTVESAAVREVIE